MVPRFDGASCCRRNSQGGDGAGGGDEVAVASRQVVMASRQVVAGRVVVAGAQVARACRVAVGHGGDGVATSHWAAGSNSRRNPPGPTGSPPTLGSWRRTPMRFLQVIACRRASIAKDRVRGVVPCHGALSARRSLDGRLMLVGMRWAVGAASDGGGRAAARAAAGGRSGGQAVGPTHRTDRAVGPPSADRTAASRGLGFRGRAAVAPGGTLLERLAASDSPWGRASAIALPLLLNLTTIPTARRHALRAHTCGGLLETRGACRVVSHIVRMTLPGRPASF